jgi:hypothetical protein
MQATDGHQIKPAAIHLLAGLQQQLPILMIINRIDQWRPALHQLVKTHQPMPELQLLYFHAAKLRIIHYLCVSYQSLFVV